MVLNYIQNNCMILFIFFFIFQEQIWQKEFNELNFVQLVSEILEDNFGIGGGPRRR